ncbi:hypothetical protein ACH5RR_021270 [Cinchona calisaya]|uniref:Uncharacterized protein n=1 Tax=Cinchona calisaya TaxID=153742 RepID=A0ABD2ZIL4_9GENT
MNWRKKKTGRGPDEIFWYFVNVPALGAGIAGLIGRLHLVIKGYLGIILAVYILFHHVLLLYFFAVYRHVPQKCLGNFGKFMVNVIEISASLALRQLSEFNIFSLVALVGFTADLSVVIHAFHIAYDVSIWDILLGSVMQIVVYTMSENVYAFTVVFTLCGGITCYQYKSYSAPVIPVDVKKDLEK